MLIYQSLLRYCNSYTHRGVPFRIPNRLLHNKQGPVTQKDYPYFRRVLEALPKNRSLAFAYGSGVFKQAGRAWTSNSMSDFIIATEDPAGWHRRNLVTNPHHYPDLLKVVGPNSIASLQTEYGARIYFNTLIPFEDGLIKYGVISTQHLIQDLVGWDTLYVAGRLHKPVNILEMDPGNLQLGAALVSNLDSALHTALLYLPERFTARELYLTLAGLSYTGDLRMVVGEDKNKVANIVDGQTDLFQDLYNNRLKSMSSFLTVKDDEIIQDCSDKSRHTHLNRLPKALVSDLVKLWNKAEASHKTTEEVLLCAARDRQRCSEGLQLGIGSIVQRASTPQAVKGVVTAGPYKAMQYSVAKLKKMFKSL